MFKITPVQDKETAKKYLDITAAVAKENAFVYAMLDCESGDLMGISQFEIMKDEGYISDLKPRIGYSDFEAMFILGRATMNFIDLCGPHKCRASITAGDERLMKSIGFRVEGEDYFTDMTGMFDGDCSSKK